MFQAFLLAVLPLASFSPAPSASMLAPLGAPCVCFPVQHAGARTLPDDPLGKASWSAGQLTDETLRIVRGSDDLFLRADALRTTLIALGQRSGKSDAEGEAASAAARRTLLEQLSSDLKRETELAPYSRARIELEGDLGATRARLAALPGVVRVEPSPSNTALVLSFDAGKCSVERLREIVPAKAVTTTHPPTEVPRAYAAITLAFAAQASKQLGYGGEIDAPSMARQAAELLKQDARLLILAGMVWFDEDSRSSAGFVRAAIANAGKDEYVHKNLVSIFGVFFDADTVEELAKKLDRKLERG